MGIVAHATPAIRTPTGASSTSATSAAARLAGGYASGDRADRGGVSENPVPDPAAVRATIGEVGDGEIPLGEPPVDDDGPRLALVRDDGRPPGRELAGHRPRFHIYTVEELRQLPAPEWLLDQHVPESSLVVLYGPPGAGKSFLTLSWEMTIARGVAWLGHATRRGAVVHVTAEGGGAALGQRVDAYCDAHALTGPVDLLSVCEVVNLLDGEGGPLLAHLEAWLDQHGAPSPAIPEHPAAFCFETMARMMPGGDENSAQDVGRVIAATDRIRQRTGATVILQHHTRRSDELERGSSALRGAADTMSSLTDDDGVLILTCTKQRDALPVAPRRLRRVSVGASCVIEPAEGDLPPSTLSARGRDALRTLTEIGESSATVWLKSSRFSEPTFYRTIKLLMDGGYTVKVKGRYSVTDLGRATLNGYSQ